MKKGIIVLLTLALVAGYAFAAFSGSAQIDLGYNFDNQEWGFANKQSTTYKFTFTLDSQKAEKSEHTTDLWAEIVAEASATVKETNAQKTADNFTVSAKVKTANIHIGEVTIGILNAGTTADYAESYYDDDEDGEADDDFVASFDGNNVPGFTVSYDGYNGGFGAKGDADAKTYEVFAHVETKEYEVAEGVTAQAAGYAYVADSSKQFGANAKAAYEADKLSADAAVDFEMVGSDFVVETAANAAYDFVAAHAYYVIDNDANMYLAAMVEASYDVEVSDIPVALTGYVDGRDLTADAREVTVGATETCTIDAVKVEAEESYAIFAKELGASVKCTYTADKFSAYAKVSTAFDFDASDACSSVALEVGASSAKIVENATLSVTYKGADFIAKTNGAVTATAKITF